MRCRHQAGVPGIRRSFRACCRWDHAILMLIDSACRPQDVWGFADDLLAILRRYKAHIAKLMGGFGVVWLACLLTLNTKKVVCSPLWETCIVKFQEDMCKACPMMKAAKFDFCFKYLGFMLGIRSKERWWTGIIDAFRNAGRGVCAHEGGVGSTILLYNSLAVSKTSYVGQLCLPSDELLAEESRTLSTVFRMPLYAVGSELLFNLSDCGSRRSVR